MRLLRDHWLETLATCATAVMLAFVYSVLIGYAAGPQPDRHRASVAWPAPQQQPGRLAVSSMR